MKKLLVCGLGGGYGGVAQVIMNVLRAVPPDAWDITVALTYESPYRDEIQSLGFHTVKWPPFRKYFAYKKAVKEFLQNNAFDTVWINNTAKVDLAVMRYAKRYGAFVVTHSHGSVQEGSGCKRFIFELLNKCNEKKFYSYMDRGIACSQSSASYFYNAEYLHGKRVEVLPNAIDCAKHAFSENDRVTARQQFGVQEDDIVLACVGRVCAVKNLGFALQTMATLPAQYKLAVIGGGDMQWLAQQIATLGIADRVRILGERKDVNVLLNGIDILLMPSLSEGLPMVALEAQANGIKCILSNKISNECKALDSMEFVPIDDPAKWIAAILHADTKRTENAAQILYDKNFDISTYAKRLTEILNDQS